MRGKAVQREFHTRQAGFSPGRRESRSFFRHGALPAPPGYGCRLAQCTAQKNLNRIRATGVGFRHADKLLVGRERAGKGSVFLGEKRVVKQESTNGGKGHAAAKSKTGASVSVKLHGGTPGRGIGGKSGRGYGHGKEGVGVTKFIIITLHLGVWNVKTKLRIFAVLGGKRW